MREKIERRSFSIAYAFTRICRFSIQKFFIIFLLPKVKNTIYIRQQFRFIWTDSDMRYARCISLLLYFSNRSTEQTLLSSNWLHYVRVSILRYFIWVIVTRSSSQSADIEEGKKKSESRWDGKKSTIAASNKIFSLFLIISRFISFCFSDFDTIDCCQQSLFLFFPLSLFNFVLSLILDRNVCMCALS